MNSKISADVRALDPSATPRATNRLLFLGSLDYAPNARALDWLARVALPHWRARRPDLVLDVVGGGRLADPTILEAPGVRVVGTVRDVAPALHAATALVAPLDVGGGSRVKLAEALAASCPVVATPVAAEGLGVEDGQHARLAERGFPFLRAVESLLDEPDATRERARAGRDHAARHLDWRDLAATLVEVWRGVQRVETKRSGVSSVSSSSRRRNRNAGTSSASR